MSKDYSPFTPGVPVPVEAFAGRQREIEELVQRCEQAQSGRIERSFVEGERGIGKSSLCAYVRNVADLRLGMLTAYICLGGVTTIEELARRVIDELAKASRERPWWSKVAGALKNHIREVGIFGVSVAFEPPPSELARLATNLESELAGLLELLRDHRRGLLLILDDINGLSEEAVFANWIKSFVDSIATKREVLPVHLILAGLPERRRSLLRLQPSLDRVFPLVAVRPLDVGEVMAFYRERLASVGMGVDEQSLQIMARMSGGYPALVHEIGDAVFQAAKTRLIDLSTAWLGIREAVKRIGERYLDEAVMSEIRSKKYRSVLAKMAVSDGIVLSRKGTLAKLSQPEQRVFDNFVRRMKELDVLEPDEQRGTYHFKHLLHRLYFDSLYPVLAREGQADLTPPHPSDDRATG